MVKVAVVGATGYTGEQIVKILLNHPKVEVTSLSALVDKPLPIGKILPEFKNRIDLVCGNLDVDDAASKSEVVFLSLPHKVSMKFAPLFLKKGKKVIDLSADYRLKDITVYEKWYGAKHEDQAHVAEAVYGLPELFREKIKKASLIANPGCYPTGSILGSAPMLIKKVVDTKSIIIDAKTGVTGAGRKAAVELIFGEVNENIKAYKINQHQHMPEINQELSNAAGEKIEITFTPHLVPMNRGILSTIYFKLVKPMSTKEAVDLYKDFYKNEPFVRVYDENEFPQTRDVINTNFCDIGVKVTGSMAIVISCIDNLWKGAASQAVQNMNIICGFKETEGLL